MKKSVMFVNATYLLSLVILQAAEEKVISPPKGQEYSFPKSYPRK